MRSFQKLGLLGFTLVEMMIVVVIIGLLASFAMPALRRAHVESTNSRLLNDYRIHAEAFKRFALETGAYPPDGGFNPIPAGMSEYLPSTWLDSPWVVNGFGTITTGALPRE